MILIADSGSTKTQWFLINQGQKLNFETIGYNPIILSTTEIKRSLGSTFIPQISEYRNKVSKIYFYGAGCSSKLAQTEIKECLSLVFPSCPEIIVKSDLWACIYATCGDEPGLCSILGTGSNACVFDGERILDQLPSLGYVLGDEGSGGQIGKKLLYAFFYRNMPPDLAASFEEAYSLTEDAFVKTLYSTLRPNQFMASFADFAVSNRMHPFIQELLKDCFNSFVEAHVLKLDKEKTLPIHFVGSVAHGFQQELKAVLASHNYKCGKILKSPFPDLLVYHQETQKHNNTIICTRKEKK